MAEVNSYARYAGANYPIESDVLDTAPAYGDTNNTFNGSFDPGAGGTFPSANDVREGVPVAQTVGNLHVPPPAQVAEGYLYDSNRSVEGELICTGGGIIVDRDVHLIRGDDYAGEGAIRWPKEDGWPDLATASVKYGHGKGFFEKACTVDDDFVILSLTKEETAAMRGVYRYDLQATIAGEVTTLAAGETYVDETHTDVSDNAPLPPGYVG